jgi:hypothetical protein
VERLNFFLVKLVIVSFFYNLCFITFFPVRFFFGFFRLVSPRDVTERSEISFTW